MDIWAWVEKLHEELTDAGQERTADLFYRIPDLVCEEESAQAEALFPEALAAARSIRNPWAEVFFRHWQLRHRLGTLAEGETALPEAVSLLEFAHREDCAACPQSICATQNIASCYGCVDGPGWAEERKAVCRETMTRITPAWSCYACLSLEYALALKDEGRPEEALTYLDRRGEEIRQAGEELSRVFFMTRIDLLRLSGRLAEALAELVRIEPLDLPGDTDVDARNTALARALIVAGMGRAAGEAASADTEAAEALLRKAWDILPEWRSLSPACHAQWTEAADIIASRLPEYNTWHLGSSMQHALDHAHAVKAHRRAVEVGERHARLAMARGARHTTERALDRMREHLPLLRAPLQADRLLAARQAELEAMSSLPLPVAAGELLQFLPTQGERDPEREVEWLLAAFAARPDDAALLLQTCEALRACEAHPEAAGLLWAFVEAYPARSESVVPELISLIRREDEASLLRLAALMEPHLPFLADWCRAHLAYRREAWSEVGGHIERLLAHLPRAKGARRFWASAAMQGKDFATAVRVRRELAALAQEEGEDPHTERWALLVAASAAEDWTTVRATCIDMGFDVEPGDAVLDDPGEWIRLRWFEDGNTVEEVAERTGPATARVLAVARPGEVQRVRDWVVFEPSPLEEEPEDEEERAQFLPVYQAVHTLERGGYSGWFVDGPAPEYSLWENFRDALNARGYALWVRSSDEYRVHDPAQAGAPEDEEDNKGLPGIFFSLGVPPGVSLADADALLLSLTEGWPHPLSWIGLAAAAGGNVRRHEDIIAKYRLE